MTTEPPLEQPAQSTASAPSPAAPVRPTDTAAATTAPPALLPTSEADAAAQAPAQAAGATPTKEQPATAKEPTTKEAPASLSASASPQQKVEMSKSTLAVAQLEARITDEIKLIFQTLGIEYKPENIKSIPVGDNYEADYVAPAPINLECSPEINAAFGELAKKLPDTVVINNISVHLNTENYKKLEEADTHLEFPGQKFTSFTVAEHSMPITAEHLHTDVLELEDGTKLHLISSEEKPVSFSELRLNTGAELHLNDKTLNWLTIHPVRIALASGAKIFKEEGSKIEGYDETGYYKTEKTELDGAVTYRLVATTEKGEKLSTFDEAVSTYVFDTTPVPKLEDFDEKNPLAFQQELKTAIRHGVMTLSDLDMLVTRIHSSHTPRKHIWDRATDKFRRGGLTPQEDAIIKSVNEVGKAVIDTTGVEWRKQQDGTWQFKNGANWTDFKDIKDNQLAALFELWAKALVAEIQSNYLSLSVKDTSVAEETIKQNVFEQLRTNPALDFNLFQFLDLPIMFQEALKNWERIVEVSDAHRFRPNDNSRWTSIKSSVDASRPANDAQNRERIARQLYVGLNPKRELTAQNLSGALIIIQSLEAIKKGGL